MERKSNVSKARRLLYVRDWLEWKEKRKKILKVSIMITKSQAYQLTEILGLPEAKVEDMISVEGVGLFFVINSTRVDAVCPDCGKRSGHLHMNHWYNIEDLPWNEQPVHLRVNRRQFWCKHCGQVFSEELAFVKKRRTYTQRFADEIVSQVLGSSIHYVAKRTGLSDEQIETMIEDAGESYLPQVPKSLKYLGIDEITVVKGQGNYYGVLVDLETHQPITLLPARTQEALGEIFSQWGEEVLKGIEGVSIDLWRPYQSLVAEMIPNATIVADRFHVTKLLNEELDKQRKAEKQAAKKIRKKVERERVLKGLTGSKYALLKNKKDLNEQQEAKLEEVCEICPTLAEMHRLKEDFRDIFDKFENWTDGTLKLLDWMKKSSTLFNGICGTIKRWFGEITSYFELSITNGVVEGINNQGNRMKKRGQKMLDCWRIERRKWSLRAAL
jgi:transposase